MEMMSIELFQHHVDMTHLWHVSTYWGFVLDGKEVLVRTDDVSTEFFVTCPEDLHNVMYHSSEFTVRRHHFEESELVSTKTIYRGRWWVHYRDYYGIIIYVAGNGLEIKKGLMYSKEFARKLKLFEDAPQELVHMLLEEGYEEIKEY